MQRSLKHSAICDGVHREDILVLACMASRASPHHACCVVESTMESFLFTLLKPTFKRSANAKRKIVHIM